MNITLLKSYSNRKKNTFGLFAENYYAFVTNQEAFAQLDSEGKKKISDIFSVLHEIIENDLTEKQREAIMMYYFEGLKMREIAEKLGVGIPAVSKRISKAEQRIGRMIRYVL